MLNYEHVPDKLRKVLFLTKKGKGKQHKKKRFGKAPTAKPSDARPGKAAVRPSSVPGRKPVHADANRSIRPGSDRQQRTWRGAPASADGRAAPTPDYLAAAKLETQQQISQWLAQGEELKRQRSTADASDHVQLDLWQERVLQALVAGDCVVVDAPTTAGKTRAVEVFFRENLQNPRFRAAYTTPVKSLSNDKLREFRQMYGAENVGIATGDIKENLDAPIVVATLESYRNSLLGVEPDLGRTLVVFDEYHYLQDDSRGSAWEEALILTPPSCQVLLLSASVANADEFTNWLSSIRGGRECKLVQTQTRPVPLANLIHLHGEWLLAQSLPESVLNNLDRNRLTTPMRQEELAEKSSSLVALGLTPAILYCGRRLACETMAALLCRNLPPLDATASALIGASLETSHKEFSALSFIQPKVRQMLQVYGVGFHHSGLAAPARMAIEALVKNGLLRFCTATMGLSLGINFSVRSALICEYQRPGEGGFTDYAPSEVLQMLGRAGRRGKDAVGYSLWPTVEAFSRLGKAKRDQITSRLRADPTTLLGLIGRGFDLDQVEHFYSKSFRRFTDRGIDLSLVTKARLKKRLGAPDLPCVSPASAYAQFSLEQPESPCHACRWKEACHPVLKAKPGGSLAALQIHLHKVGALNPDETLTDFGRIARYFPQAGGLVMARLISDGVITPDNLARAAELAGAMTLARFKEPGGDPRYRLPFGDHDIEKQIEAMYPLALFEELYDPPFRQRTFSVIREFNPAGGYVIRAWIQGMPWNDLTQIVTHEQYGAGDMMSLIYRSATYMQSIIQARIADLAPLASTLRGIMLREPLSYALAL